MDRIIGVGLVEVQRKAVRVLRMPIPPCPGGMGGRFYPAGDPDGQLPGV